MQLWFQCSKISILILSMVSYNPNESNENVDIIDEKKIISIIL